MYVKVIGAPSEHRWPGVTSLPNYSKVSWRAPSNSKLRENFPISSGLFGGGDRVSLDDVGLTLLTNLLDMNPTNVSSYIYNYCFFVLCLH